MSANALQLGARMKISRAVSVATPATPVAAQDSSGARPVLLDTPMSLPLSERMKTRILKEFHVGKDSRGRRNSNDVRRLRDKIVQSERGAKVLALVDGARRSDLV